MKYRITESQMFPVAEITLDKGEKVKLEAGTMIYQTQAVLLHSKRNGDNMLGAVGHTMVTGKSYYHTYAESLLFDQLIGLAPAGFGTIISLDIGEKQYILSDGVFLACDLSVSCKTITHKKASGNF